MESFTMPGGAALLLEGGSLRGLYTAGALDALMEADLYFPAVAGVSAGSLNGVNYVAHQPGRAASINLRYRHDPRYFGPKAALNGGSLFGLRFMLYDLPKEIPFDAGTFYHGGQRMIAVATSVRTGKPAYFEKGAMIRYILSHSAVQYVCHRYRCCTYGEFPPNHAIHLILLKDDRQKVGSLL